ncbi:PLP-dependent aminotransferase family protein [Bradyrhizobium sp. CCBAU 53421]|uniref:aminotransferase-like domain-containing protein n=1 Tax=Bradyrhizobium sp. CCBAU 53421 TaxID=1325120 RepID=UPI00188C1D56|nr:PLP-dependent aminotransferase family protein [Bradyrhizobium sp. CCBAU 53421]QOZ33246.1 PLP-dependent aminotransferase family protein [Bradyrhizobium sp. CCBAU 53421]
MSEAQIGFSLSAGQSFVRADDEYRLDVLKGTHIDLYQDIPPASTERASIIQQMLIGSDKIAGIDQAFRFHRYQGTDSDRKAAASWMAKRLGSAPDPSRVVLTHGSQDALIMLLSTIVGRQGLLLLEELTYPSVKVISELLGVQTAAVAMDDEGVRPDALRQVCEANPCQMALYCMPTVHNPTTRTMSLERRLAILEICRNNNVTLIEDDAYGLFSTDEIPTFSELAPDSTWYMFTVAKALSLQLRICLLVAPTEGSVDRVFSSTRRMTFWMATPLSAVLLTRLIEAGEIDRLVAGVKEETAKRQALVSDIFNGLDYRSRPFSPHLWLTVPAPWDRRTFAKTARENGVLLNTSDAYQVGSATPPEAVRVCIGAPQREEVRLALTRISNLLRGSSDARAATHR